ncbi:FAD-dependent monooxygenase [Kitasatospora sp. NBC_01300]|uniref:FAD-dependent monooxygenase n=1 Tax=Kitasatospora sp. NBC_01300 TaxID=2903574 RepID=UPI002F91441B|nr:FAD-dependent monooxygenase [Kitasatospora sp. NBC_01300]
MPGIKALVSGAGIAGPALAYWLARYGAQVTVVESAPARRTGGQLIDIRGCGRDVIARAGLAEAVRAARTGADGLSFVDARGRRQASMRADGFGGDGPVTDTEILRGALVEILHDATGGSTEYVFDDRISALDDRSDGVHVTFEKAAPRRFDVVVGADGLHSGVRALAFGPQDTGGARLRHLCHYLSFWTARNTLGLCDWTEVYSEPGRTIGARAVNDNTQLMAFLSFRSAPFRYDPRDSAALKTVVRSRAAGMRWHTEELIAQLEDTPDFYFDACSQVVVPHWSSRRIALVGDAAFCASPLSGHGTTIALVGAYVLAGELARARGDVAAGLRAYEERLRPWISRVQRFGQGNGRTMTPRTPAGIAFRRGVVALQERLPLGALLLRDQIRLSNGFALPDYTPYEGARP